LLVLVWVTQNRTRTKSDFQKPDQNLFWKNQLWNRILGFIYVVGTRIGIVLICCFRTPKQEVLHKH
jgi:hypothetical protein